MAKKNHLQDLIAKAVEVEDQTETQTSGDFSYEPPAAGRTTARFIEYIELGTQKQKPYMGKPKPSKEKVRITFELLGKKNIKEVEINGETRQIADKISVTVPKSLQEKSGFKKLFEKMRYGRDDIKHMAQMLGEGFLVTITHNEVTKDKSTVVYANLTDADGSYQVGAPVNATMDDEGNEVTKKLKVAEPLSELKLFLWDNPTKETWDSLFIDGEREVKDGKGGSKTVSKNWLQEVILAAEDFEGSALELMLEGADDLPENPEDLEDDEEELEDEIEDEEELEDDSEDEIEEEDEELEEELEEEELEEEEDEEPAPPKKKKAAKPAAKKSKAVAPKSKASASSAKTKSPSKNDDPLAALGLDV